MWPPKGLAPERCGRARRLGEGLHPDDGVVPPVVGVVAGPPGHAPRQHRTIEATGELLGAGEEAVTVHHNGRRLDKAQARLGVHRGGQTGQGPALHQAVGVQHHHVVIGAAEPPHPVGDVPGLAVQVYRPMPVVDRRRGHRRRGERTVARILLAQDRRIGGVAEDEDVEGAPDALGHEGFPHGLQAGEQQARRLVVDRGQDRGAAGRGDPRRRHAAVLPSARPQAVGAGEKAGQGADERKGGPGEEGNEQGQDQDVQHAQGVRRQSPIEHGARRRRQAQGGAEEQADAPAAPPGRGEPRGGAELS